MSGFDSTHLQDVEIEDYKSTFAAALLEWQYSGGVYVFQGPISYIPSGYDDYYSIELYRCDGELNCRSMIVELPPVVLPKQVLPNAVGGIYRYELAEGWSETAINDAAYARAKIYSLGGGEIAVDQAGGDDELPEGLPYVYDIYQQRLKIGNGREGLAVKLGRHFYAIDMDKPAAVVVFELLEAIGNVGDTANATVVTDTSGELEVDENLVVTALKQYSAVAGDRG